MARKRERYDRLNDQVLRGTEHWRGYLFKKWYVTVAGVAFWRVEVHAAGGSAPYFVTQNRADTASLEKTVGEAKTTAGRLLKVGTGIDAALVDVGILTGKKNMVDALNAGTAAGKRLVCQRHWAVVRHAVEQGSLHGLVFNIALTQALMHKMQDDGILRMSVRQDVPFTLNMALDSYSPICCWLGETKFAELLDACSVERLMGRASEMNV